MKSNGLKAPYFQGVETQGAFNTAGIQADVFDLHLPYQSGNLQQAAGFVLSRLLQKSHEMFAEIIIFHSTGRDVLVECVDAIAKGSGKRHKFL